MNRTHLIALATSSALVFATFNLEIIGKERLLRDGRVVLVELAPVDPRSLMQGDYMILNYAISDQARTASYELDASPHELKMVPFTARLDAHGVATFARLGHSPAPGPDEVLMTARSIERGWGIGAESFFFQEGQAKVFEAAKYGELRISDDGSLLLVGLRDENRAPLGPERW